MARISKLPVERHDGKASLVPEHVIVVRVASFVFRFESVERLRECIKYYEKKTRPSSRIAVRTLAAELGEHWREQRGWEVERWFERLPMYLLVYCTTNNWTSEPCFIMMWWCHDLHQPCTYRMLTDSNYDNGWLPSGHRSRWPCEVRLCWLPPKGNPTMPSLNSWT